MDSFLTIKSSCESKYKEKGSVFIGLSYPVKSEDEADEILTEIRKKYYDATHHCYAYKLFDGKEKYSDDGEPNGTAGIRILNAISHFNLRGVLTVVVRYFGGVKLGVGPLGKAYYTSALECLELCNKVELFEFREVFLKFDFDLSGIVHRILNQYSPVEIETGYEENKGTLKAKLLSKKVEEFEKEILNATKNKIQIAVSNEYYFLPLQ